MKSVYRLRLRLRRELKTLASAVGQAGAERRIANPSLGGITASAVKGAPVPLSCAYCFHSGPKWDVQKTMPRGRYLCKFCRRPDYPPTDREAVTKSVSSKLSEGEGNG